MTQVQDGRKQGPPIPVPVREEEWPPEHLRPDPENREVFDPLPDEELEALALSIQMVGLINAIAVREDGTIIAGEQRWRAAQQAGLERVRVRVYDVDEHQAAILRIAENLHRRTLKPSELTRALERLYFALYPEEADEMSHNVTKRVHHGAHLRMAEITGYNANYLRSIWSRRRLVAPLAKLLDEGVIDHDLTYSLSHLPQERQEQIAAVCMQLLASKTMTEEQAKEAVQGLAQEVADKEKEVKAREKERDEAKAAIAALEHGDPNAKAIKAVQARLQQSEEEQERLRSAMTAGDDASKQLIADLQEQLAQSAGEHEEAISGLREEMTQMLTAKEQENVKLREALALRAHFGSKDHLHKAIEALLPMCRADPEKLAQRLIETDGLQVFAETHRTALAVVIPWLERYRDALVAALGPAPVSGDQVAAHRARRAAGAVRQSRDP